LTGRYRYRAAAVKTVTTVTVAVTVGEKTCKEGGDGAFPMLPSSFEWARPPEPPWALAIADGFPWWQGSRGSGMDVAGSSGRTFGGETMWFGWRVRGSVTANGGPADACVHCGGGSMVTHIGRGSLTGGTGCSRLRMRWWRHQLVRDATIEAAAERRRL
jgi:hypothetical protein